MKRTVVALALALAAGGCARSCVITTQLADRLQPESCVRIAPVQDDLPADFDPEARPSPGDMEKFRRDLAE